MLSDTPESVSSRRQSRAEYDTHRLNQHVLSGAKFYFIRKWFTYLFRVGMKYDEE